jgi:GTP 3',8-cyclase
VDNLRIDSHKLMYHPARVLEWQVAERSGDWEVAKRCYPIYVEVSPVGACNHRCTFCAVDYIGYQARSLDGALLRERLAEMAALGVKSIMFAGEGEPLLHKEINTTVIAARAAGLDVAFTTNGVLLDRLEALDDCTWVKVSVNAGTPDTYARVHRAPARDWDRVWKNLAAAAKRKGPCTLGVQMVLLPENQHEIEALEHKAAEAGIDYVVVKPYSQHKLSLTREYERFRPAQAVSGARVIVREESFKTQEIPYEKCHATPYFWAYIMASGDVYSCSAYLLDPRFRLGNISRNSFREIWEGDERKANWDLVRNHLDIRECRLNCRMDKANRYLNELATGVPHANFI